MTPTALFLGLAVATAFIAHWSDNLGKKLGKKRVSVFGLRPRTSATLLTVVSSWVIMLFTLVALLLVVAPLKDALFHYDSERARFAQDRTSFAQERANFVAEQNRSTQRLALVEQKRKSEQTKAQGFQLAAQRYQSDAEKARAQSEKARAEANKARADLGSAQRAFENAKRGEQSARAGEQSARAGELSARRQQRQAATSLVSAKHQLLSAQGQIGQTQADLKQEQQQLQSAQRDFGVKQGQLKEAQTRTREAEARRTAAESQRRVAEAQTRAAQVRAREARFTQRRAEDGAFRVGRQVLQLQRTADELQSRNQEAQQVAVQYGQLAERLAFGDIRLRADQTLAERRIDATDSSAQIERELHFLLDSSQAAVGQFVPHAKVIARVLVPSSDAKHAQIVALGEDETIGNYARLLATANQPVSARLVSAFNYPDGAEEVLARFVFVPVRTIYTAQQTIGESTIDATKTESAIFGQLQKLVDLARFNAVQRGSSPPLITENDNFFDGDTGPKLFETLRQLQRLGRPVPVRVVAARDLDATEPLQIRFQIGAQGAARNTA